jgi:flavin prenyltransferase
MRLIVAITGATGVIYGTRLLEVLNRMQNMEVHLIISDAAKLNLKLESDVSPDYLQSLVYRTYDNNDLAAAISSGSFQTAGMIVIPCSIKSMSAIANSFDYNLITRAADVVLKERRRLVLVVRETPLHLGHLRTMVSLTEMGAVILPPVPAFYHSPKTIMDIVDQTVGKVLDIFNVEHHLFQRWQSLAEPVFED